MLEIKVCEPKTRVKSFAVEVGIH